MVFVYPPRMFVRRDFSKPSKPCNSKFQTARHPRMIFRKAPSSMPFVGAFAHSFLHLNHLNSPLIVSYRRLTELNSVSIGLSWCWDRWVEESHLGETNVLGLLTEALTAEVELVLADETSLVLANAATHASLAHVPFFPQSNPIASCSKSSGGDAGE